MSNNSSNNNLENESPETRKNSPVTSVEVLKGDDVISDDDHSDQKNQPNQDDKSDKSVTIANIYQWATKLKDDFMSDKNDKSEDNKSNKSSDSDSFTDDKSDSDKSDKDDKYSATVANIYQWVAKLKDDLKSEASGMTHGVSEKAVALLLNKLLVDVEAELEAFDKKLEDSEESVPNAKEERCKLVDKKEKYQGMIDQLES